MDQSRIEKRKRSPSPPKRVEKKVSRTPERKQRDDSKRVSAARSRQRSPVPLRRNSPSPRRNNRYERSPKRNFSRSSRDARRKRTPSPPPARRNRSRSYEAPRDSRRMRSRSRESRYDRRDVVKERRNPTPKRRSVERKRSLEKTRTPPVRKRTLTPKKRTPSPKKRSPERKSDSRRRERVTADDRTQQKYPERKRPANKSKSPVQRKAPRYENQNSNNNNNNNGKNAEKERSLSYSPARRNPDRYKEILDTKSKPNEKSAKKQAGPVVKLHPTESDNDESPDNNEPSKVDDYFIDKNQDKELNRLKALKSELTAKAKESLEKKLISESNTGGAPRKVDTNPVIQQVAAARKNEKEIAKALSKVQQLPQPVVEKQPTAENKPATRGRKSRSKSSKR